MVYYETLDDVTFFFFLNSKLTIHLGKKIEVCNAQIEVCNAQGLTS